MSLSWYEMRRWGNWIRERQRERVACWILEEETIILKRDLSFDNSLTDWFFSWKRGLFRPSFNLFKSRPTDRPTSPTLVYDRNRSTPPFSEILLIKERSFSLPRISHPEWLTDRQRGSLNSVSHQFIGKEKGKRLGIRIHEIQRSHRITSPIGFQIVQTPKSILTEVILSF